MKNRCPWVSDDSLYIDYHDKEWGIPLYDDRKLFEALTLEIFQAGLSWLTVLKKRTHFRTAFDDFDCHKIAQYDDKKYQELLANKDIIRHQLKIKATIANAQCFIKIEQELGSFSKYIWGFTDGAIIKNSFTNHEEIPTTTALSDKVCKDLKNRGFKFVGATIIYAFIQAMGMVDNHTKDCFRY